MLRGYYEAKTIDDQIGELIEAHGINVDSQPEWRIFVRTLKTSLDLIDITLDAIKPKPKICPQCDGKGEIT